MTLSLIIFLLKIFNKNGKGSNRFSEEKEKNQGSLYYSNAKKKALQKKLLIKITLNLSFNLSIIRTNYNFRNGY